MQPNTTFDLAYVVNKTKESLERGNSILFLGAGASMEGKGPSGKELTLKILADFPEATPPSQDFLEVCQDIVDTPPYDTEQLCERVRHHLTGVNATQSHMRAARLPWAAIFTTNYDDAIEKGFDHRDCTRRSVVHYLEDRQLLFHRADTTPLFKIMGCVRRRGGEVGEMVLTRGQYNGLSHFRHRSLDALYDALKSGTLVFAGYSFADRLVFDALDQLILSHNLQRIPWSYCIGPNPPGPADTKSRHQLERRRIIPIEGTFSQFITELWKSVRQEPFLRPTASPDSEIVQLHDCRITIDPKEYNTRADAYVLLTERELSVEHGSKDDFFEGKEVGWAPYKMGWDFQRPAAPSDGGSQTLAQRVKQLCSDRQQGTHPTLILLGGPGTGKTTVLKRIAYDIYTDGTAPVLMLNMRALRVDFGQIHALLEAIHRAAAKDLPPGKSLPVLIIIDDAATQLRQWIKLRSYLASKGHSCIFLAAEREGEWYYSTRDIEIDALRPEVYKVAAEFSDDERERIVSHLFELGYLRVRGASAIALIRDTLKDSLFATFYSFVHPSRVPLNKIVEQQYTKLPPVQREAFAVVCLLAQYGLDAPFELLVRTLQIDFDLFHKDVLSGAAAAIIYEDRDANGQLYYRPHHRIVAERTIARFLSDEADQYRLYKKIFSQVNLSNPGDWKVMTRLVADFIGPNAERARLTPDHLRDLLDTLIDRGAGRSILHHRGLLELKHGNYSEAEVFLKRALSDRQRFDESYRSESDQNILTSLGTVYSNWGIDLRKQGQTGQSDRLLEEAARCFVDARKGRFGSPHAYHAHAIMLRNKARMDKDALAAADYISEALLILEEAKEDLDEEVLLPIRELEGELLVANGDPGVSSTVARQLATEYGSSAGFAVWAGCEARRLPRRDDAQFESVAQNLVSICQEGLQINPADYRILKALAGCYRIWGYSKREDRYDALLKLSGCYPRFSPQILYELASLAFVLGRFKDAKARFEELRLKCEAHEMRFRAREHVSNADGTKRVYKGFVYDLDEIRGEVSCNEFRDPYFSIYFNPRYVTSALSRNDGVVFNVHFNQRGPYAREVHKA